MPGKNQLAKGTILLANGNLTDTNFKRTLVLLCEHGSQGAYGLILNQPAQVHLSQVFPDTPEFTSCDLSLYTGGPCELDRIQVLHSFRSNDIGGALICSGIYAGGDFLKIIAACKAKPKANRYCRFYRGYSGWGANQLETEMEANAWIVCKAARDIVFSSNAETMWPQVLKSMGGYYSFLATMPPDLSAN